MCRLGHQLGKLLISKREFVRHQWRNEEKSYKNGGEEIHLRLQAEISAYQTMFAQQFEVDLKALQSLCVGSAAMLAEC